MGWIIPWIPGSQILRRHRERDEEQDKEWAKRDRKMNVMYLEEVLPAG